MGSVRFNAIVLALVIGLIGLSIYTITDRPTVLGLDLRGGIELVYQGTPTPATPEVEAEDIDDAIEIIRERVDALGVSEPEIARIGEDQVSVGLPDVQDAQRAIDQVGDTAQLYFYDFQDNVIPPNPELENADERPYNRLYDAVLAASEREAECPENQCTTNGPTLYMFDSQTLELLAGPVEAGGDSPEALEQAREDLLFTIEGEQVPENAEIHAVPQGTVVLQQEEPARQTDAEEVTDAERDIGRGWFVLRDLPGLSGDEIRDPQQNFDPQTNQPIVTFSFSDEGRQAFHEITREIAQRGQEQAFGPVSAQDASALSHHFAVVLDGEIVSRPIINFVENPDGIDGRTGAQISGTFTIQEAQDLARFLRIGALPVNLTLISQSSVSATLGQEALDQGLRAGVGGLVLVLLFLILYYRFLGVVAALGLGVYALLFMAMIKAIPITLTLPGIAGLVLTFGIAADSNIVIFERIKEEVSKGRSFLSAISEGYRRGLSTIIDANVITLITAFILFVLATGGVKGFAFTLGIGTLAALFTAVLFTRAFLATLSQSAFVRSPKVLGAAKGARRWNLDFAGMSKYFFALSGLILLIGAVSLSTNQLNFGIDFESGLRAEVGLEQEATPEEVRATLSAAGVPGMEGATIQEVADTDFGENVMQIRAPLDAGDADIVGVVQDSLAAEYGIATGEADDALFDTQVVGPTFGEQVARSAVIAIILSLLVISAYVAIRFEPKYAVPVIIATFHDILIAGGIYSLAGREVTSATVAAFLTIVGLSLYDSVIVFDRIRENVPRLPRAAFSQVVNRSVSEVLTRSIITGVTTLFVLSTLMVFGGETLQDFAFAMIIGIFSGFYSSIFIATPVLMHWKEREPMYKNRRERLEQVMGYVPRLPEQNEVSRLEEADRGDGRGGEPSDDEELVGDGDGRGAAQPRAATALAERTQAQAVVGEADGEGAQVGDGDGVGETTAAAAQGGKQSKKAKGKKRRQKRNRKHGRPR